MDTHMNEDLHKLTEELNILLKAKTVEEALYGLIVYLQNGLVILNEVLSHFEDKT